MFKKIIGITVGTPTSPTKIEEKIKPVKSVNGTKPDSNGNVTVSTKDDRIPSITSTDNGKVLTAQNGSWVAKAIPEDESLPSITSTDNGKVLTAQNGSWIAKAIPEDDALPDVTSSDDGKYLVVDGGEWVAGNFIMPTAYMIGDPESGTTIHESKLWEVINGNIPLELMIVSPLDQYDRKIIHLKKANNPGSGGSYHFIGFELDQNNKFIVYNVTVHSSNGSWELNTHEIPNFEDGNEVAY